MDENIVWHEHQLNREDREKLLGQKGCLLWFTGLSGSGKSTVASKLQEKLNTHSKLTYVLDGDNVRHGINSDLGFTESDRVENIRRIGEVSKLFVDCGVITLSCFISPYNKDRDTVRSKLEGRYVEVFIDCDLETCEKRDPKGLYKKARNGDIKNFTGIDAPYEKPINPEIIINTSDMDIEQCVEKIYNYLISSKLIE